jgi:class 3 adenylate cyclase
MPGRFEDPAVERAYVEGERRARIPGTRFLAAMGMVTLISYIGFNPLHFPREGVIAYNIAAAVFLTFLAGVIGLTFTRFYIACGWIDIVIFSALGVAMIMLIDALGDQAAITGISRFGMAIVNLGILVVFAAVGFVATTRYFLAWATLVVVLYLAFLIQADRGIVNKVYTFTNFTTFLTFAAFVNWDIDRRARKTFAAQRALDIERQKTEDLLFNVLPPEVAQRLREGQAVADSFSDVSVVFIDIVGFSQLARRLSPGMLVKVLNEVFSIADGCADRSGVEKVKTIGDAYLAVAGGQASGDRGASEAIHFGCEVIRAIRRFAAETGLDVRVRVGIHTGPVVGGVVGSRRYAYDYWGDTMNVASRIEGIAEPDGIAVSESTYFSARDAIDFAGAELHTLKGVGEVKVYRVDAATVCNLPDEGP